ncbi:hypothetical protein Bca52824_053630 [Brassica carinata]|uniref:Ubiquitin-like protease family profile domain-containing protein n=1 Tax=Brassica carinata TaxID=52824 RepID=A0A8X7R5R0_BRACI|nr:hypothetical protein Bca52824_053630 [Brassica carinata]
MKQRRLSRYFSQKGVDGRDKSRSPALKEGDEVPLLYTQKGDETEQAHVVQFGTGSNTFYVTEEEVGSKTGGCCWQCLPVSYVEQGSDVGSDIGAPGEFVDCGTEVDFGDLNRLVGVITREVAGEGAEKEGRKATGGGEHTKDIDGLVSKTPCTHGLSWEICTLRCKLIGGGEALTCDEAIGGVRGKPKTDSSAVEEGDVNRPPGAGVKEAKDGGMKGPIVDGLVAGKDGLNCHNADEDATPAGQAVVEAGRVGERCGAEGEGTDTDGSGDEQVMELSDSSPCQRSEKQKPLEREAELAALLLHLNDGKFDLDNQFFIELAISQEWVSTKHMEALVEYVANRHEDRLKERRCIFLPPWFVAHLQGKARAFNAAKVNRGRVLGDGRLSGFLTKEGGKWGVDVETLYAPMIWDGNHWVGLCISLTDWRVLVLDPNRRLKDMAVVRGLLEAVPKMLPYLVEKCVQFQKMDRMGWSLSRIPNHWCIQSLDVHSPLPTFLC